MQVTWISSCVQPIMKGLSVGYSFFPLVLNFLHQSSIRTLPLGLACGRLARAFSFGFSSADSGASLFGCGPPFDQLSFSPRSFSFAKKFFLIGLTNTSCPETLALTDKRQTRCETGTQSLESPARRSFGYRSEEKCFQADPSDAYSSGLCTQQ